MLFFFVTLPDYQFAASLDIDPPAGLGDAASLQVIDRLGIGTVIGDDGSHRCSFENGELAIDV